MKKIYRSLDNRIISGVCGGMGDYFNIDPVWFRIMFILLAIFYGYGLLFYVVSWVIIPEQLKKEDKLER